MQKYRIKIRTAPSKLEKGRKQCIKPVGFDKIIYQICTNREIFRELGNPIEKWMPS